MKISDSRRCRFVWTYKTEAGSYRLCRFKPGALILAYAITAILTLPAQAQTPTTTSPPSNPPTPTPIPAIVPAVPVAAAAQTSVPTIVVVDSFDSVTQWTATPADGVEVSVHPEPNGAHGKAMRVDFDFHGHGGYAVIHRAFNLALPQNYEFSFAIKGDAPTNTLEFKLIDSTGANVWWSNNPNFVFPKDWKTITRKKRQISFAWGPTNDKDLKQFAAIEFAITAGSGGKGTVWLDDLVVTPIEPDTRFYPAPLMSASSQTQGYDVYRAVDADLTTGWRSAPLRVSPTQVAGTSTPPGSVPLGADIQPDAETQPPKGLPAATLTPRRFAADRVIRPMRTLWLLAVAPMQAILGEQRETWVALEMAAGAVLVAISYWGVSERER